MKLGHMPGSLLREQSRAILNLCVQYGERSGSLGYVNTTELVRLYFFQIRFLNNLLIQISNPKFN